VWATSRCLSALQGVRWAGICQHQRQRSKCKECGGAGICRFFARTLLNPKSLFAQEGRRIYRRSRRIYWRMSPPRSHLPRSPSRLYLWRMKKMRQETQRFIPAVGDTVSSSSMMVLFARIVQVCAASKSLLNGARRLEIMASVLTLWLCFCSGCLCVYGITCTCHTRHYTKRKTRRVEFASCCPPSARARNGAAHEAAFDPGRVPARGILEIRQHGPTLCPESERGAAAAAAAAGEHVPARKLVVAWVGSASEYVSDVGGQF
jgi:hypothetical protein